MSYSVQYDPRTGLPTGIARDSVASIPLDPRNADFAAFLAWNATQATPLDYITGKTMIWAQLDQTTGLLSNIRQGVYQFDNDVRLMAMPTGAPGEQYTYDTVNMVAVPALSWAQKQKCEAIDAKTVQLLAAGFSYTPIGGTTAYQFGLDSTSVSNWIGMTMAAASLPYPFTVATVTGALVSLSSAQDVQAFFGAGVARSAAIQQGGIALKAQVSTCTTIDQVNAIADNRT